MTGLAAASPTAPPTAEARARAAARYLLPEEGRPADPVARFHLGNGAILDAVLPDADPSPVGLDRAWGVMVSYLYDLSQVDANHEAYVTGGELRRNDAVDALLA